MKSEYFVMLYNQQGGISPLVDENGDVALFPFGRDARAEAEKNIIASTQGYSVFNLDHTSGDR